MQRPIDDQERVSILDAVAHPVWIFAKNSFRILYANRAAQAWLGYSKDELEALTIVEIRPEDERESIKRQVQNFSDAEGDAGLWTIISKSGYSHRASFFWHCTEFHGKASIIATITDNTSGIKLQEQQKILLKEVSTARETALLAEVAYRKLFEAAPGKMLVLEPQNYQIVAATDEYIAATMTERQLIYGRGLFDVFPDNPDEADADGEFYLRASLKRVKDLGLLDVMSVQRYPIRNKEGVFEDRFWMSLNKPVFDANEQLTYIIHRVEDVTDLQHDLPVEDLTSDSIRLPDFDNSIAIHNVKLALLLFKQNEARLRTVRQLFKIGTWEVDPERGLYHWSDRVSEIYGIPSDGSIKLNQHKYLELVHPEDRDELRAAIRRFGIERLSILSFQHRVVRSDGKIIHIKGMGQRQQMGSRELIVGFVQDITDHVAVENELASAQGLIRIAGEKLRIGAWRVDASMQELTWSDGMYHIFELELGEQPSIEEGLKLYTPENRRIVSELLGNCAASGTSFDQVLEVKSLKGRNMSIRLLGWPETDGTGKVVAIQGAVQDLTALHEAEQRVMAANAQRHLMLESISDAFFALDDEWRFTYLNSKAAEILHRDRDSLIRRIVWDEFPEALGSAFEANYHRARETGQTQRFVEFFEPLKKWFEVSAYAIADGLAVYFRDASEEIKKSEQLRLLEAAAERLNDALIITDASQGSGEHGPKIVYVNPAVERMTGWSAEDLIGVTPRILQGPDTYGPQLLQLHQAMHNQQSVRAELVNYNRKGSSYWVDVSMSPVFDERGNCTHFVAVERDVTEWKQNQKELELAATRDAITGLYNRSKFEEHLHQQVAQLAETDDQLALILIDCDNFKSVNDTLGHFIGDALLRAIADRLSNHLDDQSIFGRLGGDEFIILVPKITPDSAMELADVLRTSILKPFSIEDEILSVTVSIGLVIAPDDASDAGQLMRDVDMAMYRSKQAGRNHVTRFDQSIYQATVRLAGLTQALQVALTEQKGFWLAFQPFFSAKRKDLIGAEALLRWHHPERGTISPAEFIPAAENAGLIRMLDNMVIGMAANQLADWFQQGFPCPVSINLSARSLQIAGMGQQIVDRLAVHGAPSNHFCVEITESIFLEDSANVAVNLDVLRRARVKIAIDDFGTGHSSLSYLQRLPLDVIKVDRSFIEHLGDDESNANSLATAIILAAKALKLSLIAEGVETPAQAKWLTENGCDALQGFLLGKPVDANLFLSTYQRKLSFT